MTGVLAEGEAWLSRTGGIGGLSGSDVVLSGPTEGEDWDEQYQHLATMTHSYCCTHQQDDFGLLRYDLKVDESVVVRSQVTSHLLTSNVQTNSWCYRHQPEIADNRISKFMLS